jgi:hypothetical protein
MYRIGKSNERADALSRKLENVSSQDRVIAEHQTQVLLPREKLADKVIRDLQLVPVEYINDESRGYELIDKLLMVNRKAPKIEELRVKAYNEKDSTWQL